MGRRGRPRGRRAVGAAPGNGSAREPRSTLRGPGEGRADRRRAAKRIKRRRRLSATKEIPILVGVALLIALVLKTFLVQAFVIPSGSMEQTIRIDDRVLVDKLTPWFGAEPERGEVVVFHDPGGWLDESVQTDSNGIGAAFQEVMSFIGLMPSAEEQDLIKRVIAVGGDTVACEKNGPVTVNGKALDEKSYIYPGNTPCGSEGFGPVKVPEGRIWVMGDHRHNSLDSRFHQELPGHGTVSVDDVVGRAIVKAWPIDRWGTLPVPDTFAEQGLAAAPAAMGLAGAVPLVLWRRRLKAGTARARDESATR